MRFSVVAIVLAATVWAVPARAEMRPGPPETVMADVRRADAPVSGKRESPPRLVPHRATYGITLRSAASGSGISGARGAMQYRFSDACDAWTVESQIYLRMEYEESGDVETTWAFASWESKNAQNYRFRVRQNRDGESVELLQGRAKLFPTRSDKKALPGRPRSGGVAQFTDPEEMEIELPKGTMFPTAHLAALIEAARSGASRFARVVFDGSSVDNPYEINAIIDKGAAGPRKSTRGTGTLPAHPSWRVQLAYFPVKSKGLLPEFEMNVRYREDGIAEEMFQDFGNFMLDFTPQDVEVLPTPDC